MIPAAVIAAAGELDVASSITTLGAAGILALLIILLMQGRFRLDREVRSCQEAKAEAEARAERWEQLALRLLTTTEKAAAIAEKDTR